MSCVWINVWITASCSHIVCVGPSVHKAVLFFPRHHVIKDRIVDLDTLNLFFKATWGIKQHGSFRETRGKRLFVVKHSKQIFYLLSPLSQLNISDHVDAVIHCGIFDIRYAVCRQCNTGSWYSICTHKSKAYCRSDLRFHGARMFLFIYITSLTVTQTHDISHSCWKPDSEIQLNNSYKWA